MPVFVGVGVVISTNRVGVFVGVRVTVSTSGACVYVGEAGIATDPHALIKMIGMIKRIVFKKSLPMDVLLNIS